MVDVVAAFDQRYKYCGVPPEAEIVAAPLFPSKHETLVEDEIVEVNKIGCIIVIELVEIHALESVIVTV